MQKTISPTDMKINEVVRSILAHENKAAKPANFVDEFLEKIRELERERVELKKSLRRMVHAVNPDHTDAENLHHDLYDAATEAARLLVDTGERGMFRTYTPGQVVRIVPVAEEELARIRRRKAFWPEENVSKDIQPPHVSVTEVDRD